MSVEVFISTSVSAGLTFECGCWGGESSDEEESSSEEDEESEEDSSKGAGFVGFVAGVSFVTLAVSSSEESSDDEEDDEDEEETSFLLFRFLCRLRLGAVGGGPIAKRFPRSELPCLANNCQSVYCSDSLPDYASMSLALTSKSNLAIYLVFMKLEIRSMNSIKRSVGLYN